MRIRLEVIFFMEWVSCRHAKVSKVYGRVISGAVSNNVDYA